MISGVFAASLTPLKQDFSPDLDLFPEYLSFLADRGCHGALVLGTTGEGPSFSPNQRVKIFKSTLEVKQHRSEFQLLAGTGTPSLDETSALTKSAFDLGMDGVVILPPFYFRNTGEEGLISWYLSILETSVPEGGTTLAYHIPAVSGVPLSIDLLSRLHDAAPDKFVGVKDSSGDKDYSYQLGKHFGNDFLVFTGNDRLLSTAMENHAIGCITAIANIISPDLRNLWHALQTGQNGTQIQEKINSIRLICEQFQPFPPLVKFLVSKYFNFPYWPVCPPLTELSRESQDRVSMLLDLT